MADNRPFRYFDSQTSKFDDEDIKDQIKFQVTRNNVKKNLSTKVRKKYSILYLYC